MSNNLGLTNGCCVYNCMVKMISIVVWNVYNHLLKTLESYVLNE